MPPADPICPGRRRACATAAASCVAGWALAAEAPARAPTGADPSAMPPAGQPARWQNWSGLWQARPRALVTPASEAEVADLLAGSTGEVRAVGAGHSFTPLVPTGGLMVSLDRLAGVLKVDREAGTATVGAGTRLAVLSQQLDRHGLALRNLPDVDVQTLAGALATGTHGTGAALPALHDDVVGLRLVRTDGRTVALDAARDPQALAAARVSLGSLGIVTQVTLRVVPAYALERRVWLRPTAELLAEAPALAARHRHFELFVLPFTGYTAAVAHDVYAGSDYLLPHSADDEVLADLKRLRDWLGRFPALRTWAAQRFIDPAQTELARHRAHRLLSTVRPVRFNETEWHVPAAQGIDTLQRVVAAIERHDEAYFPIEFRWVRGDGAWLSPFHGRDSCSIAVHAAAGEAHDYIVGEAAPLCRAVGGRPHWGKLHGLGAAGLAGAYPRWRDFLQLRREFDPGGRLLNSHLRALFGEAAA